MSVTAGFGVPQGMDTTEAWAVTGEDITIRQRSCVDR
jgi:hypothetical protein